MTCDRLLSSKNLCQLQSYKSWPKIYYVKLPLTSFDILKVNLLSQLWQGFENVYHKLVHDTILKSNTLTREDDLLCFMP